MSLSKWFTYFVIVFAWGAFAGYCWGNTRPATTEVTIWGWLTLAFCVIGGSCVGAVIGLLVNYKNDVNYIVEK